MCCFYDISPFFRNKSFEREIALIMMRMISSINWKISPCTSKEMHYDYADTLINKPKFNNVSIELLRVIYL